MMSDLDVKSQSQNSTENEDTQEELATPQAGPRKYQLVYRNVLMYVYWHSAALYGLYLYFTSAKWQTMVFAHILYIFAGIGITAGTHRLWSHRTFKAKLPLQILLMVFNSIAFQNSAIDWVRDHRLHHKYTDTDADPHNASRGFFYSHVGWLLVRKHEDVKTKGKTIDLSDVYDNPVLRFQKRYALPVISLIGFILPTLIPIYMWNETLNNAWHLTMLRFVCNLNSTWFINSAAHMFGNRPYDKTILSSQNKMVSVVTLGEGFHNYHHVFPWDYRAAELGKYSLNWTTLFIDFFTWIGWAYDLKTVPKEAIERRAKKTGDGTYLFSWGNKNMAEEDTNAALILSPLRKEI